MKSSLLTISIVLILFGCESNTDKRKSTNQTNIEVELITKKEINQKPIPKEVKQNLFNRALKELYTQFKYKAQGVKGSKLYNEGSSDFEGITSRFKDCSNGNIMYDLPECDVNFDLVKGVKSAFIKGEKPLEGRLYLKVKIQEWMFETTTVATKFESKLNECRIHSECVNKGGVTWWRVEDRMYIMETSAYRFSFEFDKIKEAMIQQLKS